MPKRSKFSLSNYKLFSCDGGELVPCNLTEVLPGDVVQMSTSALVRASPLLTPVMHPVHVRIHHWFVPHRLVWEDWEDFITGGPDGMDASVFPTITHATGPAVGSLGDYLGLPTGVNGIVTSALPYRGYALIFNEWYRDQDLVTPLVIDKTSGADTTTSLVLQKVAWEKDYFTSARPWEQKGPSITVPVGGQAPVTGIGISTDFTFPDGGVVVHQADQSTPTWAASTTQRTDTANRVHIQENPGAAGFPNIFADLSAATGVSINVLREAFALQRFEEARAQFGSRYTEYLRYLGVKSSDARLQRPEYLGGGKQTIQFSEVLQTGVTTSGNEAGVGTLRGHVIGSMRSNRFRRYFEEHGYIMSFMSIKPKTMYFQGIPRTWSRTTKEDFWQVELQHIGQQEVLNKEIYAAHATPAGVFGYQDRYDEYRRQESTIGGEFRTTLNMWHMAREFSSDPALNSTFVTSTPTERTFAVPGADVYWVMAHHSIQARRLVAQVGKSFIF